MENIQHIGEDNRSGVWEARREDVIEEQKRWEEDKYNEGKETIRKEI